MDRLHADEAPQPTLCPHDPCEPPCTHRSGDVDESSEKGVAVSMPKSATKSMLTMTTLADVGRCKRMCNARGSSGAMGCHGCRRTRPNYGRERHALVLPNFGPDGTPRPKKGGAHGQCQRLFLQDGKGVASINLKLN